MNIQLSNYTLRNTLYLKSDRSWLSDGGNATLGSGVPMTLIWGP